MALAGTRNEHRRLLMLSITTHAQDFREVQRIASNFMARSSAWSSSCDHYPGLSNCNSGSYQYDSIVKGRATARPLIRRRPRCLPALAIFAQGVLQAGEGNCLSYLECRLERLDSDRQSCAAADGVGLRLLCRNRRAISTGLSARASTGDVSPKIRATIALISTSGPIVPKPGMLFGSLKSQSLSCSPLKSRIAGSVVQARRSAARRNSAGTPG